MLLHRVSLQGFLAHHGQQVGGQNVPIELDFRAANLWLMHGPNGSGKSTVFDAITFALFDEARGSKFLQLVNDRSDVAHVEVEFEVKGQRFLVKRRLKLTRARDSHQMWGEVSRWNEEKGKWEIEAGVGSKVKEWASKTLQISYANFVSAVVLKQGEADRFLLAKPPERKDRLMELLDLDVYKRLGSAANARRTSWVAIAKDKQNRLNECQSVSDDELSTAKDEATLAQKNAEDARIEVERAQKKHEDAVLAATLGTQIQDKERLQTQDAAILQDEAAIEDAARELDALSAVLPSLHALADARNRVQSTQQKLQKSEAARDEASAKTKKLEAPVGVAEQSHVQSQDALTKARQTLEAARVQAERAENDAQTLVRIQELERQVEEARLDLKPHQPILDDARNIAQRKSRVQELREAGKKVKAVDEAREKLKEAKASEVQAERLHSQGVEDATAKEQVALDAQAALEEIAKDVGELSRQKNKVETELQWHNDVLARRQTLGNAVECPTCGTQLHEEAVCERLLEEQGRLQRDIDEAQERQASLDRQHKAALQMHKQREVASKAASESWDKAKQNVAGTSVSWQGAKRRVEEKQIELEQRREEAGEFADANFAALKAEAKSLGCDTIESEVQRLEEAQRVQLGCESNINACFRQLKHLPEWDEPKRADVRALLASSATLVGCAQNDVLAAEEAERVASAAAQKARRELQNAEADAKVAAGLCDGSLQTLQNARDAQERELARLLPVWSDHAAAHEDEALRELQNRSTSLKPLAARRDELTQAKQRSATLQGAIEELRSQKAQIPPLHCVPVEEAIAEWEVQIAQEKTRREGADVAAQGLSDLSCAQKTFESRLQERDFASSEAARYDELAKSFGRDGLQAKIVREAQHSLTQLSNGILGRLSNGSWQIDLRGDTDTELEIVARDEGRGGIERTFDCLSGGERFRVAISLAIAIGQMACGGAPMNTLVIDEGFGALDEENRALMVDNLRHLSEHELRNGRIIVVSHQDDVCEAFSHRLRLSRDGQGYAQVETMCG